MLVAAILILFLYVILGYKKPGIALVTLPIVCFLLCYVAVLFESFEYILFAIVMFLSTLVTILAARREPDTEEWPQKWAKWILIGIPVLLLVNLAFVAPLAAIGFGFFILIITAIINYGLTSRHAIAAYVISTIGSSMRQNLPLPMALETAAGGRGDSRSKILLRIKKWLVQGYSLSEAIKRGYPKCPGFAVAMIAAAEKIDQLPLAIGAIEADMVVRADEKRKIRPVHPFYPVLLITFMFFIMLMLMWQVVPIFSDVLTDMTKGEGVELPAATRFLSGIASFVAYEYSRLFGFVVALIVIIVVPISIYVRFRPRRPHKPYLLSRIGDFVKWHLPILHWFEKNYSMVQVVELLRLSLNAGCTVNNAIANTLGLDVNNCERYRLKRWLARVEAGENIAASAKKNRLSSALAWAFDEKVNQGNTLTILETLESFYRLNYSYRVNLARYIMWPCVTLWLGSMVGFVLYGIFSPMVLIINILANNVTP